MKLSGIYKIINLVNGDFYLGSSVNLDARFRSHSNLLKKGKHINIKLQRAWNKYGADKFIFHVVEYCSPEKCVDIEDFYLNSLECKYNISKSASAPMLDRKHSNKTLEKLKGRKPWNKGKARTEEEKLLMSKMRKIAHQKMPPEKIESWKENLSKCGNKPWLGKKLRDEMKDKISEFWKNKNDYVIYCEENGKRYLTQLDAAKDLKIKQGHISEQLNGNRKTASGYTFKKVKRNV